MVASSERHNAQKAQRVAGLVGSCACTADFSGISAELTAGPIEKGELSGDRLD